MSERMRLPWSLRLRGWLFERCFNYCVRFMHPDADPAEFRFLDTTYFVAVSKSELHEIMQEAPEIAWRFAAVQQ